MSLQSVNDPSTDQNFRALQQQLGEVSNGLLAVVGATGLEASFGTSSLTWSGATTAGSKSVAHGLDSTPILVIPQIVVAGASRAFANAANYGATTFTLFGYAADGVLSETLEVKWIAIG